MYNFLEKENDFWILIDFIEGKDGKEFNKDIAINLSKNLSDILNKYWVEKGINESLEQERFDRYWNRINKRKESLKEYPLFELDFKRANNIAKEILSEDKYKTMIFFDREDI